MIDEKKLIEDIANDRTDFRSELYTNDSIRNYFIGAIEEQPKLDVPEINVGNNWIPCSERLPEQPKNGWKAYLVQNQYVCDPYTAYWDGNEWQDEEDRLLLGVIAWMPLPEPYKAGDA